MSNTKQILKDAIADAKAVRETALAQAKLALEEAFTPQLQSMLAAKLQEMEEEDEVKEEVTEAADAFGASKKQKLWGVQIPLALPNIMQGINQCTMMALSMVVIASMIGTRGLGDEVLLGLQQLNVGRAAEAGIAIVLLAIVLDRITQSYGETLQERNAPAKKVKK